MSPVLLCGSRGYPEAFAPSSATRVFRISHRALPLALVQELMQEVPEPESITAIGGGTVMDAAKVWLHLLNRPLPLTLVPTTFATGAEVTEFASVYADDGRKLSLSLPKACHPVVVYHPELLRSLPDEELAAGMADAFSHGFESLWALAATEESRSLAEESLRLLKPLLFLAPEILRAEQLATLQTIGKKAGQAIAISRTTAAHAYSYELSQRNGIPHGFAVLAHLPALQELCSRQRLDQRRQLAALALHSVDELCEFIRALSRHLIPAPTQNAIESFFQKGRMTVPCPARLANFPIAAQMTKPLFVSSSNSSLAAGTA